MSLTSRFLLGVGLALVLLACSVNGHGWMTSPSPRGQYKSPAKSAADEIAPATRDPTDPNIICRGDPVMPQANWLALTPGKSQSITLEFTALHVGDCFVYLSYDGDKPETEMKWFKIWEQHACKDKSQYDIPIPSYLPKGDHVVFRWEWYALHVYPIVEYYSQCVDATMSGAASGALPTPQVTMPGHLPELAGNYANNTNNYWWPWDTQPMFFTGPAVASIGGAPYVLDTTSGVIMVPSASPAPTTPPATQPTTKPTNPTTKPTDKPAATVKPTDKPAATVKPTDKPAATVKPTDKPAATAKPTDKPAATAKPTDKPASTQAPPTKPPVNNPPAQSVKLNVLSASSTWWLAVSISGHRATEVTKIEFKDSGVYSSFTEIPLSWDNIFAFSPDSRGAITFPATVKASLASGSSLSFVVNGLPATIIDSGAVFP